MSTADKADKNASFFSSASLWGGLAGCILGFGVATAMIAGPFAFPLIVLGSAAMGVAFGNSVGSILSGEQGYVPSSSSRQFTGGDLEKAPELIDHLRLRENQYKEQIEKDMSELRRSPSASALGASKAAAGGHFQNMLQNQPVGQIRR